MRSLLKIIAFTILVNSGLAWAGPSSAGGPITVDSTTFVPGQSVMGTDGGVYSDTLPPVASTTTAAFRMTKYRALHTNLRDSSGAEVGTSGNPLHIAGTTTVNISTVQVTNSSFSVTGSTVNVGGTVVVSVTGTPNVAVTNTPNVSVTNVPAVRISSPIAAGTNNIGTVSGSTVNVAGVVATSITGTPTVYVVNPSSAIIIGKVDTTGSTVTLTNTGFAVTNIATMTVSGTPDVYIVNSSTITPKAGSLFNVTGSTINAVVTGAVTATVTGGVNATIVNVATTTVSGTVNVTGSTVTVNGGVSVLGTPSVSVTNTPNVAVTNTPNVAITSIPPVTIRNSSFSVTGSTINVAGSLTAVIGGTLPVVVTNISTVSISGTPTINAAQSGTWSTGVQVLNVMGVPTSVGYASGATQIPTVISDGVSVASVTNVAGQNGLNVNIIGGAGAGGTSSNFGADFPTAGTALGFINPSGTMQAGRVDASSNTAVVIVGTPTVSLAGTSAVQATVVNIATTTVAGTVTVSVSNVPNVSVTNTPSVNATVVNQATVTVSGSVNASIVNTPSVTLSAPIPAGTNTIGTVNAVQLSPPWSMAFSTGTTVAVLTSTGVTTNVAISTPVAASGSTTVRIFRLVLTADAATTINFRDGATSFGESYYLSSNGSIVLDVTDNPWFITSAGNGFGIAQTGSAHLGVRLWFTQS